MKRFLALDYGLGQIGLAINFAGLAEPLTSLDNDQQFLSGLKKLIAQYQVNELVIGCSEGMMAQKTKDFGQELAQAVSLPVHYIDETLSSREAETRRSWLKGKKKRQLPLHPYAAAIILQHFLDEHGN